MFTVRPTLPAQSVSTSIFKARSVTLLSWLEEGLVQAVGGGVSENDVVSHFVRVSARAVFRYKHHEVS